MHNYYLDFLLISESLNFIEPTKENYHRYLFIVLKNAEANGERNYAFEKGLIHAINIYSALYKVMGVDNMQTQWEDMKPKRLNDIMAFLKKEKSK